jgi:hypothetical protein
MARITKWSLKQQIFDLHDKSNKLHDELRPLMESDKITTGSYYFLLSPQSEHTFTSFYKKELNNNRTTISQLKRTIHQAEKFIKCQELVLETGTHDLKKYHDIMFERN